MPQVDIYAVLWPLVKAFAPLFGAIVLFVILGGVVKLFWAALTRRFPVLAIFAPSPRDPNSRRVARPVGGVVGPDRPMDLSAPFPKFRRVPLLSLAELKFFAALIGVVPRSHVVFSKVRVGDLVAVDVGSSRGLSRLNGMHVDFVIFNPSSTEVDLVIELDDASHGRADRQARDELVDRVLKSAGVKILHVKVSPSYHVERLREVVAKRLNR